MSDSNFRLTEFSRGAGCGCKISPKVLDEILHSHLAVPDHANLLVGNNSKDDAAVYDLGNGTALVSTTDFFMPIVDDAFDFGRIAAANSISDIYSMGAKPLVAIAILGWPVDKLPADLANRVMEGGRQICKEAGIPLAGGHSIDSQEPFFGLAVTGTVNIHELKRNNTIKENDFLFLTKPLGVGMLSTALKRAVLKDEDYPLMISQMTRLNKPGERLGKEKGVHAMTDVTGFGLLGHLLEMIGESPFSAELNYNSIPILQPAKEYAGQRIFPDATTRNWNSYSDKVKFEKGVNVMEAFIILPDPQTNGGLLISVDENAVDEVIGVLKSEGLTGTPGPIGRIRARMEKPVMVMNS